MTGARPGRRLRRRRIYGALIAALVTVLASALPASADTETKTFTAEATPSVIAGDQALLSVTITNTTYPQELGSANITVPQQLTVIGQPSLAVVDGSASPIIGYDPATGVIELRDLALAPLGYAAVTIAARAPCTGTSVGWEIQVKQSNDFNGTGNDFQLSGDPATTTITGDCALAFTAQPADTVAGEIITDTAYAAGGPVTVTVWNGDSSAPVSWWGESVDLTLLDPTGIAVLAGTTSKTPVGGVAEFDDLSIATSAAGYRLVASTAGLAPATSAAFDIVDAAATCTAGNSCSVSSSHGATTATVSATEGAGNVSLTLSIDPADLAFVLDANACDGYVGTSGTIEFYLDDATRTKTVSITLDASEVDKPYRKYDVCFAAPEPFTTKDGGQAQELYDEFGDPLGIYAGLLPDCDLPAPGPPGSNEPPCVVSRERDNETKDVTVTFRTALGDPWGKI